jgi:hypothetical protein
VSVVSGSVAVLLASAVSCAPPDVSSTTLPGCWLGTERQWCLPPIPINSCQDIVAEGVNPTTHPTPPTFCVSCGGVGSAIWQGMGISPPKRPFLEVLLVSSMTVYVLAGCSTESALNLSTSSPSLLTVVWMVDPCSPRLKERVWFIGMDGNVRGTSDDVEADA